MLYTEQLRLSGAARLQPDGAMSTKGTALMPNTDPTFDNCELAR